MGWYSSYVFPRLLDWTMRAVDPQYRRRALAPARGRVLEVGFGTGVNLPYYPDAVERLTVIDSERLLSDRVARRIAAARMPVAEMRLDASGGLPFEGGSFDAVVTTFTLCSVSPPAPALAEIRRVLKPAGQYLFLEHGRSDDPRTARLQDLFNPLQRRLAGGCHLNRPIDRLIAGAGLKIVSLDRFVMPGAPRALAEMYQGVASPPG